MFEAIYGSLHDMKLVVYREHSKKLYKMSLLFNIEIEIQEFEIFFSN